VSLLGAALIWQAFSRRAGIVQTSPQSQPVLTRQQPAGIGALRFDTPETRTVSLDGLGTMVIHGPADLEFIDPLRARLRRGRIRARITSESGHGYVVETPRAQVTDLGTEFGIDVAGDSVTGVVVFEGSVNLAVPNGEDASHPQVERLTEGQGVVVRRTGRLDRLMSIVVGEASTFGQPGEPRPDGSTPLIADVWDSVAVTESKNLYEIVPAGFKEDARCYADRPTHEWNGIDEHGLPAYLIGADYVRTFNNYKFLKGVKIKVMLSRPARLFIFLDRRVAPPDWLRRSFHETGDSIGMDEGPFVYRFHGLKQATTELGVGPGQSIDGRFFVWDRVVKKASVVTLGENGGASRETGMYGIAAVELDQKAR
jgi:hypothetical protein